MTALTAVSAAIYAARALAYLPGLSILDATVAEDGETVDVLFTSEGVDATMTVWIEAGELYGEW